MHSMRVAIGKAAAELGGMPMPVLWAFVGAFSATTLGAIAGLVLGLLAHPPSAWFAIFELGIPAGAVGALVGLLLGSLAAACRWAWRHRA